MFINTNSLTFLQIYVFLILLFESFCVSHSNLGGNGAKCRKREQMALLQMKADLVDDFGRLSSWESTNCCEWEGVVCDNSSNHVVALHLRGPKSISKLDGFLCLDCGYPVAPLRGKISPSLLQLSHLQYLDLSLNDFHRTTIPDFIGSLSKLSHLSLSHSNISGQIPHHIGNLSSLQFLDLRGNRGLRDTNLDWLSGSPSLQYLDLSWSDLSGSTTWLQVLDKLTSLTEIHLSGCHLVAPVSFPSPTSSSNSLLVLDLSNNFLDSRVLLRFLNISSFTYIDFSYNNLEGGIPDAMGNLKSLSHLALRYSSLSRVPDILENLTNLSYLDLSHNQLGQFPQPFKNSSSLTYLDLSWSELNGQLSHLLTLLWDFTSLHYLLLRGNVLSGLLPNMSRFSNLNELDLGNNLLSGEVLESNLRLPNLEHLDLSKNKFIGRLPNLSSSPSLAVLVLTDNTFSGSLTENFHHLSKIEYLVVGYNQLEDVITETHLSYLPMLTSLDLSFNLNITIRIDPSWIPIPQFHELILALCKLGPRFPKWLQKLNKLEFLDISSSGIVDTIPSWFWGNIQMCTYLNVSHNQIHGFLPNLSSILPNSVAIDLSSNQFTGSLPLLPPTNIIDLSRNRFSSPILNFCNFIHEKSYFLDLSNNFLWGEIPQDCFMNFLSVDTVNLGNNNFSGEIEISTTKNSSCRVSSLHLRNNSFRGEFPMSLMNCSELSILDLGENEFNGTIPGWLGGRILELRILILKSNMFYGSLPSSLCHLSKIQVLDISLNKITGTIPICVNNFTVLSSEANPDSGNYLYFSIGLGLYYHNFYDSASVVWKGIDETYFNTLGLLKMIDLSSNELFGEIPLGITTLIGLVGLNLSRNNLVGSIPHDIYMLKLLNFLDLSRNHLSGVIPPTLSKVSHLGVLNLSFNNLSGRIPWDTHMQTFEASTYFGNPRLCGSPLSRQCREPKEEKSTKETTDSDQLITKGFYISMVVGFITAFWIVFWTLLFNKWWDAFSITLCTTLADGMYAQILVNKRRFLRYFCNA